MRLIVCLSLCVALGCGGNGIPGGGGGGGGGGVDMTSSSTGDMVRGPCCGQPGDKGNALGVGEYCTGFNTGCTGQAGFCANISDPKLHFCTMTCTMGSTTACGTGASCQCQNGQCGCVPDACLNMPSTC